MRRCVAIVAVLALSACGASTRQLVSGVMSRDADHVDRVWLRDDDGAAKGAFRIFLSDGTLVEGACGAPYRLAAWREVEDGVLAWETPDGPVQAEIAVVGPKQFGLVVDPAGEARGESHRRGRSPLGC